MDFNLEIRLKQLKSLEGFISHAREKVQCILDSLQWNVNDTRKESAVIKCSVDPNHRVSTSSAEAHIEKCLIHKEGYNDDDSFLSEPSDNPMSSIRLDDRTKLEVLLSARHACPTFKSAWNGQDPDPKTSDRLISTFSSDERLALYNYAVTHTTGPPQLPEFNLFHSGNNEGKTQSEAELLKKERDAKRRRIKHKSVHTNHKNYTEIIREVIKGQMELYSEWVIDKDTGESSYSKTGSITNLEDTENYLTSYAESIGKHSTYSASSSITKQNYDKNSTNQRYEYSEDSYKLNSHDHSPAHARSYNSSNRSKERSRDHHNNGAYRRHRSRSRSSGRYNKKKRYRSRSPHSRHRRYSSGRR